MNMQARKESRTLAQVMLVIVLTVFSLILISLCARKGWDKWVTPVFALFAIGSLILHITALFQENIRIYIYSACICLELFYYVSNIEIIFNCTPIIIFVMLVFLMTREKKLVWICAASGILGMLLGFLNPENGGRLIWHTVIVFASGHIMMRFQDSVLKEQEELHSRINALTQETKSADDFLTNVSHEIRTPVNVVIGLSGVCMEKETNSEIKSNLKSISEAGKRVAEQINDILDYSEIEMNKLVVNPEEFMLSSLINDLVSELKVHTHKDIELVIDVEPSIPYVLKADHIKLKRVLWHVIVNALKYTREGGVYVHIDSTPQSYGINLCIDVTDTGIGMTKEELERVYEHFYQSDSGRTRTESGLGLGMSVALGLIEALEGFIKLESSLENGTTAHICVPAEVIDERSCLSIKEPEKLVVAACLHFEKFSNPSVRDFYNNTVKNTVRGLKLTVHRVDSVAELKILAQNIKMTHIILSEEAYLSDPDYMRRISEKATVIVTRRHGIPADYAPRVRLLEKPFYSFPMVSILNEESASPDESDGKLYYSNVKALVVDDEPMNITVANSILGRYGIEVIPAHSGQEAIDLCAQTAFDVIFMDHMMPGMDGIEAAKRIRSTNPGTKRVPIVALTANAVSSAEEMFMKEGFDGFISKPIEIGRLERVLKKVLPDYERIEAGPIGTHADKTVMPPENNTADTSDEKAFPAEEMPAADTLPADSFTLLSASGIDTDKGMELCLDDLTLYISLMAEFSNDAPLKQEELERYHAERDWENFTIRIHSIKSSSKMIGAMELSERAMLLEDASKKKDEAFINANFPEFMPRYIQTVNAIKEAYGDSLMEYLEDEDI